MAIDIMTLASAKNYADSIANSLGAVKGAPCSIKSITEGADGMHVVFSWTGTNGTEQTQTMIVPYVAVDETARSGVEELTKAVAAAVKTVNGTKPDADGNVQIEVGSGGSGGVTFTVDSEGNATIQ